VFRVAGLRFERLADRHRDVESDQVEQGERPHRMSEAESHAAVDVDRLHPGSLHQPDRFEEIGKQQAVDHEAGHVGNPNRGLADRKAPALGPVPDHLRHSLGNAEFDQGHVGDRVEDVDTHQSLRSANRCPDRRDREGRGGRSEVGTLGCPERPGEDLCLDRLILGYGFDDQVGAG